MNVGSSLEIEGNGFDGPILHMNAGKGLLIQFEFSGICGKDQQTIGGEKAHDFVY